VGPCVEYSKHQPTGKCQTKIAVSVRFTHNNICFVLDTASYISYPAETRNPKQAHSPSMYTAGFTSFFKASPTYNNKLSSPRSYVLVLLSTLCEHTIVVQQLGQPRPICFVLKSVRGAPSRLRIRTSIVPAHPCTVITRSPGCPRSNHNTTNHFALRGTRSAKCQIPSLTWLFRHKWNIRNGRHNQGGRHSPQGAWERVRRLYLQT
jgi:hypothetical protein